MSTSRVAYLRRRESSLISSSVFTYLEDLPCIDRNMKNVMQACTYGTVIILFVSTIAPQIPSIVSEAAAISATNQSNITITMERGMCMGTCPVYSLDIFGNGIVVYNGERFVNVTGKQVSGILDDKVRELVKEFYAIGYFSLNDTYDKIVKTDQPTVLTSINVNGTSKSIFDNLGAIAPKDLRLLENEIDEVTNSSKWVEPYVHPPGVPIRG
ncbi:MAG TPA: DUF6438 domain-containing protein [Nitrososphaeraceae archaeon]|nr:DUF6438 domain-containing protein [Nitrososphaeraceae archaeon]